jgi:hypothetical protein
MSKLENYSTQSPHSANTATGAALSAPEYSGISPTLPNRLSIWVLIAVLIPPAFAFWILYRQQFSLPYQDDYGAILGFATEYRQLPGLPAKLLYVATKQDNDYKLGFEHSIVAMQLDLAGHLSFGFLVTLGNLFLLAIAYVLWRIYRREELALNQRLIEFIPASLLFFSLAYWESLDWAMAALQNLPVILFSLLSIYLLIPQKGAELPATRLLLSCISAILASMSSANGFLLGPIGLFILWRRRALVGAAAWCATFLIPVAAYLYHYRPYYVSVGTIHNGSYVAKAFYFSAFLGCAIHKPVLAALTGVAVIIVFTLALWTRFDRTNQGAFYSMVWIVLTAGLVGFLRQNIAPRYSIYSVLALTFCYCFLAQFIHCRVRSVNQNRFYAVSVFLALVFCLMSDKQANLHLKERREMVLAGMEHYRENPEVNAPTIDPQLTKYYPDQPAAERIILNQAIQEKVYALPPAQ